MKAEKDMKKRKVPCIIAVPKMSLECEWDDNCFSQYVGDDNIIKFYFGDKLEPGRYSYDVNGLFNIVI